VSIDAVPKNIAVGVGKGGEDGDPDAVVVVVIDPSTNGPGGEPFGVTQEGWVPVASTPVDMVSADLGGAGGPLPDIVSVGRDSGTVSVIVGRSDDTIAPAVELPVGSLPSSIAAADIEHDGDIDLAVVATNALSQRKVLVLRNDTNPSDGGEREQLQFADAAELFAASGDPETFDPLFVFAVDLDGDGRIDVNTVYEPSGAFAAAAAQAGPLDAAK
jgi:hypothetical protein